MAALRGLAATQRALGRAARAINRDGMTRPTGSPGGWSASRGAGRCWRRATRPTRPGHRRPRPGHLDRQPAGRPHRRDVPRGQPAPAVRVRPAAGDHRGRRRAAGHHADLGGQRLPQRPRARTTRACRGGRPRTARATSTPPTRAAPTRPAWPRGRWTTASPRPTPPSRSRRPRGRPASASPRSARPTGWPVGFPLAGQERPTRPGRGSRLRLGAEGGAA